MTKEDDYRAFAAQSLELASRASNLANKLKLLLMAEAWLNLADKISRHVRRPSASIREHPAVSATLGPEQREADYIGWL